MEPIIQSAQFDRLEGKLFQGGKEKIRMLGTFAEKKDECLIERYEKSPPEISPIEDCIRVPKMPNYSIFHNLDVRLDPTCAGWMRDKALSVKSEIKGWIKFKDDRAFDIFSIALVADSCPPAVFSRQGMVAWVPTLEFSVNM